MMQTRRVEGEASLRTYLRTNHPHGVKEDLGGLVWERECPVIVEAVISIARKQVFERQCCTFGYNPIKGADTIKRWRITD
jgi:hypothetical protein